VTGVSGSLRGGGALALAAALLLLGLGVDLALTQPELRDLRRLKPRRAELQQRLQEIDRLDLDAKSMARYLGGESATEDLAEALARHRTGDDVNYLNSLIEASGVRRGELGTDVSEVLGKCRRTQYYVRVYGRYEEILDLVRRLEAGGRLAGVDAMVLSRERESTRIEARLKVSLYHPAGTQGS